MANLKELRARIRSVNNTQQITKAMKMVAAAKLRRSQDRAEAARPYSEAMEQMLGSLAPAVGSGDTAPPLIASHGREQNVRLVAYTADRGLCGGFNSGVVRAMRLRIAELQAEGKNVTITCIGSKGHDVLKRQFGPLIVDLQTGLSRDITFEAIQEKVAHKLLNEFNDGAFDACYMVFNKFQSAMTQILTWQRVIPVQVEESDASEKENGIDGSYLFEPSDDELLGALLPQNVMVQLYHAMVETDASEHGSRMTAMDSAVRNAADMINKLTITYNRTRQAAITTELMEIIGGAESLKG